ncbi:MAG TPA: hemerythrin domain-containing protein [Casimicrobiaceae bacterium]|nr:hemerythrin domain-containing protein [Casimicrobiaceae bacterium]
MTTISEYMLHGHSACDDLFANAENAAGDWKKAAVEFARFRNALDEHIAMEEEVLFPAFEAETGMADGGPSATMRAEHVQMRALLDDMADAATLRDERRYLGVADTLLVLMQQHNMKEESMMYPMIESAVPDRADALLAKCRAIELRDAGACTCNPQR